MPATSYGFCQRSLSQINLIRDFNQIDFWNGYKFCKYALPGAALRLSVYLDKYYPDHVDKLCIFDMLPVD